MPTALISVYDKTGIEDFARKLHKTGWDIISSGGTYKVLSGAGIPARKVEDVTGLPEIMDNRVKTLHPKIHGGILADRDIPEHLSEAKEFGIGMIDMVVVNLYPFADATARPDATEDDAIHNIDIGGSAMLRAAAKNWRHVTAIIDPADYQTVLAELVAGGIKKDTRKKLAVKVFAATARYDGLIANYFSGSNGLALNFDKVMDLRYGENPHQQAALFTEKEIPETSVVNARVLHGKKLSYNNIMDADAALNIIKEFGQPAAAAIKHTNPCGCAVADNIDEAFVRAYEADSKSAFGGVLAMNRTCTKKIAEYISSVFAEVVLAPDFESEAISILEQKKNIRLLKLGEIKKAAGLKDYRKIVGGMLQQDLDRLKVQQADCRVVTKRQPTDKEWRDMLFAWPVIKHVKSNAILLVKDKATIGVGAGQMSRVDSAEIAVEKAGAKAKGSVCASDAFFPFPDSVELLAQAGVRAIIQPGGSIKDVEVIQKADELNIAMVFTGMRVFKH